MIKIEINGVIYPTLVHALRYHSQLDEEDFKKDPNMFTIYKKITSRYFRKQYEIYAESPLLSKINELDLDSPTWITPDINKGVPLVHFFINHNGLQHCKY